MGEFMEATLPYILVMLLSKVTSHVIIHEVGTLITYGTLFRHCGIFQSLQNFHVVNDNN